MCSLKLVQVHDWIWWPAARCSGLCICDICGREYFDHKPERGVLFDGYPFLNVLCNGERVKL
jgi:hypothetical protein